jgi:hypothetical protein
VKRLSRQPAEGTKHWVPEVSSWRTGCLPYQEIVRVLKCPVVDPSLLRELNRVVMEIEHLHLKRPETLYDGFQDHVKYLITHWIDEFDYDGMTSRFSILGDFHDLAEARACLNGCVDRLTAEQISQHADSVSPSWHVMSIKGKECPLWYRVNKNNTVVDLRSFTVGDGTGFNSIYNYLEVIELLDDAVVDKNLFDLEDCGFEVGRYFDGPGCSWNT